MRDVPGRAIRKAGFYQVRHVQHITQYEPFRYVMVDDAGDFPNAALTHSVKHDTSAIGETARARIGIG